MDITQLNIFNDRPIKVKTTKIFIKVGRRTINKSRPGDAIMCPLALSIRSKLKSGDVICSTKQLLYYTKEFDREDINMVLGEHRITRIDIDDDLSKILKVYDSTGIIEPFNCEIEIPDSLL